MFGRLRYIRRFLQNFRVAFGFAVVAASCPRAIDLRVGAESNGMLIAALAASSKVHLINRSTQLRSTAARASQRAQKRLLGRKPAVVPVADGDRTQSIHHVVWGSGVV